MLQLKKIPAFGFQTATANANGPYQILANRHNQKIGRKVDNTLLHKMAKSVDRLEERTKVQRDALPSALKNFDKKVHQARRKKMEKFDANSERLKAKTAHIEAKKIFKWDNFTKVAGYVPLVGSVMGIIRIAGTANTPSSLINKKRHYARGCVELVSLGVLFVIPDLIVTGHRVYKAHKLNSAGS